ncbi:MAG: hypothetical protein ACM3L5_00400 [Candidatus Saccharibacteria bacterium]
MSYSTARKPNFNLKKIYNKWRMATLGLDLAGLITFFFALGMAGWTVPLMAVSVVLLWAAVVVAYKYLRMEMGKPFEPVARVSYVISLILALILSVLTAITVLNG